MGTINLNDDAVRKLAHILDETNLTEIEDEENGSRIYVARQPAPVHYATSTGVGSVSIAATEPTSSTSVQLSTQIDFAQHPGVVKSPMVGSAYLGPDPSSPPFVKLGDAVTEGQSLMIIEAMKVMNPIKATRSGTVTHILVSNAAPVEFGQPLMVIE